MTVAELIEQLQAMPLDREVMLPPYQWCPCDGDVESEPRAAVQVATTEDAVNGRGLAVMIS